MNESDKAYVIVGRFGSTFGVRGWLKIQSYTEFSASILDYQPWYIAENDSIFKKTEIEEGRLQNDVVLVKIAGINSPEEARLLTGKQIAILRSQLPPLQKNEYYWSDLKGLTVINKDGLVLGKIIYLMETGSNDVLIVKGEKEHAIPYIFGRVILNVDLQKQEMHVDWEPL